MVGLRINTRIMFCLFVIFMVVSGNFGELTWNKAPEDTSVQRGQSAILYCQITGLSAKSIVIWQKGKSVLFIGHTKYSAPDSYEIMGDASRGEFNMKVNKAEPNDDDVYECSADSVLTKSVRLQVIVTPSVPTVTLDQGSAPLKAKQKVTFNCSSTGGNPAPSVRWYRNGQLVTSGFTYHKATTKFGLTSSVLEWLLARTDNRANFTCEVLNEGNDKSPYRASKVTNVLYPPVVWFEPKTPLKILKNSNSELRCLTDGNPAVTSVKWSKAGTPLPGVSGVYRIVNANPTDHSTTYTCEATNSLGTTSNTTSVDVLYKPVVTIPNVSGGYVRVNETDDVSISCVVSANPRAKSITWRREGSTATVSGNNLLIHKIERSHAGRYTCEASNLLLPTGQIAQTGRGNSTVHIIVQYRPGVAQIEQAPRGQVIRGQKVVFKCSTTSKGIPEAIYRWTKDGDASFKFEGPTMELNSITISDMGVYTCTPRNVLGEGVAARIQLNVDEPVTFLAPDLETKKYVYLQDSAGVSVMCRARGRPAPQITWYKNGHPIVSSSSQLYTVAVTKTTVNTHSTMITSVLQWKGSERKPRSTSLQVEDSGNYTCLATNGVLKAGSRSVQLYVQYIPIVTVTSAKVAANINQSVMLSCAGHAYPSPVFSWYRHGYKILQSEKTQVASSKTGATLNITNVNSADLGEYVCMATNDLGNGSATIVLSVKTVPESPGDLRAINVTWESAFLTWQPGFHGGYDQWFIVSYHQTSQRSLRSRKRILVQPNNANFVNITGLMPSQHYTFAVFGENSLGGGAYSSDILVTTKNYYIPVVMAPIFSRDTQILKFNSPSESYCVRISASIDEQSGWKVVETCAPSTGGSIKLNLDANVVKVNVSLCLDRRQDVCSQPVSSRIVMGEGEAEVVPATTIIIVGSVCGVIVVVLLIVLVVLFCRRRKGKASDTDNSPLETDRQVQTVMPSVGKTPNPVPPFTQCNNLDDRRTYASPPNILHADPYDPRYTHMMNSNQPVSSYHNEQPISLPPPWSKHDAAMPREAPPMYSEYNHPERGLDVSAMNRKNHSSHRDLDMVDLNSSGESGSTQKSPSFKMETNSTGSSAESGYSTPDPTKPKKVIYEVIV